MTITKQDVQAVLTRLTEAFPLACTSRISR
jgi:hypothetical protein